MIIPVYERHRMLVEAIDSVLAQTVRPDEIIVVDDGSPTPVADCIEHFGDQVRLLRQENKGIGGARNTGIEVATGDFLSFLDSDDLWMPHKTEHQLDVLRADPELECAYGRVVQFHDPESSVVFRENHPIANEELEGSISSAMLIRRESFDRVGPFGPISGSVDVDWQLRAREAGLRGHVLDEVVFRRRIHETNHNVTNKDAAHRERLLALKDSLDRRRAREGVGGDVE